MAKPTKAKVVIFSGDTYNYLVIEVSKTLAKRIEVPAGLYWTDDAKIFTDEGRGVSLQLHTPAAAVGALNLVKRFLKNYDFQSWADSFDSHWGVLEGCTFEGFELED